jgi:hypothetical protein
LIEPVFYLSQKGELNTIKQTKRRMKMETILKVAIPDKKAKGFLRRQEQALRFQEIVKSGEISSKSFSEMIDFLVGFVTEPADRKEARELLVDLSQEEYETIFESLKGNQTSSAVPLAS